MYLAWEIVLKYHIYAKKFRFSAKYSFFKHASRLKGFIYLSSVLLSKLFTLQIEKVLFHSVAIEHVSKVE